MSNESRKKKVREFRIKIRQKLDELERVFNHMDNGETTTDKVVRLTYLDVVLDDTMEKLERYRTQNMSPGYARKKHNEKVLENFKKK